MWPSWSLFCDFLKNEAGLEILRQSEKILGQNWRPDSQVSLRWPIFENSPNGRVFLIICTNITMKLC